MLFLILFLRGMGVKIANKSQRGQFEGIKRGLFPFFAFSGFGFMFLDIFEEEGKDGEDHKTKDSGNQDIELFPRRYRVNGGSGFLNQLSIINP